MLVTPPLEMAEPSTALACVCPAGWRGTAPVPETPRRGGGASLHEETSVPLLCPSQSRVVKAFGITETRV